MTHSANKFIFSGEYGELTCFYAHRGLYSNPTMALVRTRSPVQIRSSAPSHRLCEPFTEAFFYVHAKAHASPLSRRVESPLWKNAPSPGAMRRNRPNPLPRMTQWASAMHPRDRRRVNAAMHNHHWMGCCAPGLPGHVSSPPQGPPRHALSALGRQPKADTFRCIRIGA